MNSNRQVFISYGRDEIGEPIAQQLYDGIKELKEPPLSPFLDTSDLEDADKWRPQLARQIEDSFLIIVLCSQKANGSQYVTFEWSYAMGKGKKVLPVEIQKPTPGKDEVSNPISPLLLDYNSTVLDFTNPSEQTWQDLLDTIVRIYYQEYTPTPIQRAVEFAEHPLNAYRQQALRSLYENEHHKSVEALVTLVKDSYLPQVRWEASQYLARKAAPETHKIDRAEAVLQHQKKQEIAIPELEVNLWSNLVGQNVVSGGQSRIFSIAVGSLRAIGTERAYATLADFYIQNDIRDNKQEIVSNFSEFPLPEVESHMVRMLKHRDDDSAPPNKWELIHWLVEAGNKSILSDIIDFLHGERPDIRVSGSEREVILEEYMQGYRNTEDVLPVYQDVLEMYLEKNVAIP